MGALFFPECVPLIKGIVFIALERIYLSKNIFARKKIPFFISNLLSKNNKGNIHLSPLGKRIIFLMVKNYNQLKKMLQNYYESFVIFYSMINYL